MLTLKPLHNWVVMRLVKHQRLIRGLHIPGSAKDDRVEHAIVIAVGPKCEQVKVGDRVLPDDPRVVMSTEATGEKLYTCPEDHIMVIVAEEPDVNVSLIGDPLIEEGEVLQ